MTRRHALVCLLAGACSRPGAPPAGGSRPLDDFEDLSAWKAEGSGGVLARVAETAGVAGSAMRLDFDFQGHGGYAIARRALPLDLPPSDEVTLDLRGDAPVNTPGPGRNRLGQPRIAADRGASGGDDRSVGAAALATRQQAVAAGWREHDPRGAEPAPRLALLRALLDPRRRDDLRVAPPLGHESTAAGYLRWAVWKDGELRFAELPARVEIERR